MKSGIKLAPFTMPQGNFPRMIVSPIDVLNPNDKMPGITRLKLMAMWDTGADYCMISPSLARNLRLTHYGDASVNRAEGEDLQRKSYLVNLVLPNGVYFDNVIAIEDNGLNNIGVEFLIGLAVINGIDFALTHDKDGGTVLSISFPAGRLVDFCSGK